MARSPRSSMAWALLHDARDPPVYLRSLVFKTQHIDATEQLSEALLYFTRAGASQVQRSYLSREWRVVPVWS